MGSYNSGMGVFSTLITVGSLLMGAWLMMKGELSAADLVTFLLYINNFTEPVKKLVRNSSRTVTAVTNVFWRL